MKRPQVWTLTDADDLKSLGVERTTRTLVADEIGVHFQPIVDLQTRRTFAQEALVRCRRPGFERPDVLIAQAVTDQSMGFLGRLIREVALPVDERQGVFVNLHPDELESRWLIRPDDPLNTYSGPLYLEITEAAAMGYFELCRDVLNELCGRTGAQIVVDDLGAGYSNLKRIIDLKPSFVKLDRELTRGLDVAPRQRILVANVVRLCVDLGARVVAEGIETRDELSAVIDCGVHYGQGYLLARPAFPPPAVSWPT
ncbi:MAG: EAL domain-containing protein [Sandaracinus sp.]|nr:EAL domain-containing protein [Sandaracinus sp.]